MPIMLGDVGHWDPQKLTTWFTLFSFKIVFEWGRKGSKSSHQISRLAFVAADELASGVYAVAILVFAPLQSQILDPICWFNILDIGWKMLKVNLFLFPQHLRHHFVGAEVRPFSSDSFSNGCVWEYARSPQSYSLVNVDITNWTITICS